MKITDEIKAAISRLVEDAQSFSKDDIRGDLFDRYMGEPYGDEQKGKSSFVSTDVADAVEAIMPDIMDVFTSAEDIVEFSPVGPEDEAQAKQETSAVSHVLWQKNLGFEILYTWFKEALIQQNSYVKYGWQEKERVTISEYEDLNPDELAEVFRGLEDARDSEYEVLEQDTTYDELENPVSFNVKIRCVKTEKKYCIECIPQEEFFATPQWSKVSLDGIPCCGHRRKEERGALLAMGFDKQSLDDAVGGSDSTQKDERFDTEDNFESTPLGGDDSTEKIEVYEVYVRVDLNGDGKAELCKAWCAGDGYTLLQWENGKDAIEEVSKVQFACLTPYIIPHRHVGRSVAELVDDLQRLKTVLWRITLDNTYATQYARPYFDENNAGNHTYADLMKPEQGAPVRTGGADIQWYSPPPLIGSTLPLIEKVDDVKEARVGATRYNQGLDADSLNKTASGIAQIMNASQKKVMLIARTFAETGLRELFLGIHDDLQSGPWKELAMKLAGDWVSVNPRTWKTRTDTIVKVGQGTGDRESVRAGLHLMGGLQRELMMGGSRIVNEEKIYNTAEKMMATFGFKTIEPFMTHPSKLPPAPPPPPNPQEELAKVQMQILQNESQGRMMLDAKRAEMAHQQKMMELQIRKEAEDRQHAKAASDILTDQERLNLDRKKAVMTDDLARDKLAAELLGGTDNASPISYGEV